MKGKRRVILEVCFFLRVDADVRRSSKQFWHYLCQMGNSSNRPVKDKKKNPKIMSCLGQYRQCYYPIWDKGQNVVWQDLVKSEVVTHFICAYHIPCL